MLVVLELLVVKDLVFDWIELATFLEFFLIFIINMSLYLTDLILNGKFISM